MPSTVVRRVLFTPPALLTRTSRRSCVGAELAGEPADRLPVTRSRTAGATRPPIRCATATLCQRRLAAARITADHHDPGAAASELDRGVQADPARRARDQHGLAADVPGHENWCATSLLRPGGFGKQDLRLDTPGQWPCPAHVCDDYRVLPVDVAEKIDWGCCTGRWRAVRPTPA